MGPYRPIEGAQMVPCNPVRHIRVGASTGTTSPFALSVACHSFQSHWFHMLFTKRWRNTVCRAVHVSRSVRSILTRLSQLPVTAFARPTSNFYNLNISIF